MTSSEKFTYLFDLDGTLVNTDGIYVLVWQALMKDYGQDIDEQFFFEFIQGRSDPDFLKALFPEIKDEDIKHISKRKDELFIELVDKEDPASILVSGALEYMRTLKDNQVAIVTNCNRAAAQKILDHTGMGEFVQHLVAAEDCELKKPHPAPYLSAIKHFNADKEKVIIFEDSPTGYRSAKAAGVFKVVVILHKMSNSFMRSLPELKISTYTNFSLDAGVFSFDRKLDLIVKTVDYIGVKRAFPDNVALKTGYICNIDVFILTLLDNSSQRLVVKTSNHGNTLAETAEKLGMYEKEALFYEVFSSLVSDVVHVPKWFGNFRDGGDISICMDDLSVRKGSFGLDLNTRTSVLLRVVTDIAKMHSMFRFERPESVIKSFRVLHKVSDITHYMTLVRDKFPSFLTRCDALMLPRQKTIVSLIAKHFDKIVSQLSSFPLSFCHGDLKSANIFYEGDITPFFLDWQYIHLGKGVSDIVFLCVESLKFDSQLVELVLMYYYRLMADDKHDYDYKEFRKDVNCSLCCFPFFVAVWFNTEDPSKLLDKTFPIRFLKGLLKYFDHFLTEEFFNEL